MCVFYVCFLRVYLSCDGVLTACQKGLFDITHIRWLLGLELAYGIGLMPSKTLVLTPNVALLGNTVS